MKVKCEAENASRFADWIENRGGLAVWRSADLGDDSTKLILDRIQWHKEQLAELEDVNP